MTQNDIFAALWEQAYEQACIRAVEEGDVDLDQDYALVESWTHEYFIDYCNEAGLNAAESDY